MKKKNLAFITTVLLVVTLGFTGCRSKTVKDSDYVLRVGIQSDLCLAPLHIAIEKGFFGAEGLKFEAIKIESAVAAEAIAGNQIDAGFGLLAKFIQPLENGLPLKFTSGIHTGCIKIVTAQDSDIKSLADLRGKKVGVPGLMASPSLIAKRALAAAGVGVTGNNLEVDFVVYSNADLYVALGKGAIDAVAGGDPGVSVAIKENNLRVLLDTATDVKFKNEYCCLSFVTAPLAEKHPEIAAKFTRAVIKASEWVEQNPLEAAKIQIEKNYVAGDADFNASLLASYDYKPSVHGGYVALKNTIDEFKTLNLLVDETNAQKLLENSFLFVDINQTAAGNSGGAQKIKIRFASTIPSSELASDVTTSSISYNYFIKEIEKQSSGRITVEIFPDGQLASSTEEHIGGMKNGAFDICNLNNGAWADYTQAFAGLNIPYLYFDFETVYAVLDSEIGRSWMKKAHEATGLIPLAYIDIGFRELTNSVREIRSPADLKGIKLRTMVDNLQMAAWRALGVAVTPVPYAELYTALQQRLVDGQENPVSNIVGAKLYELQPYMTITNHNYTATIVSAGPVFWNKLSAADQQLVRKVWLEAQDLGRQKTAGLVDVQMKIISDAGVKIYHPTAAELKQFQDQVKTVWPDVEKAMGAEDFNKLVNFVSDYTAAH